MRAFDDNNSGNVPDSVWDIHEKQADNIIPSSHSEAEMDDADQAA